MVMTIQAIDNAPMLGTTGVRRTKKWQQICIDNFQASKRQIRDVQNATKNTKSNADDVSTGTRLLASNLYIHGKHDQIYIYI